MTISVTKPSINLREKLNELDQPQGIKGTELLRADTAQEVRNAIGAGRKNLIINGAMQVAQRGTSSTGVTSGGYYTVDRHKIYHSGLDQLSLDLSQDTDSPDGFAYSHKIVAATPETVVSPGELSCPIFYRIEGQDLQHLNWGTSDAKSVTLSFWVKSNVTGTYTVSFFKTLSSNRVQSHTFSIDTAGAWEYKTITISGDTSVGIYNTNTTGLDIYFNSVVGSNYTGGTEATVWSTYGTNNWAVGHTADWGEDADDYINITGVQLELGSTATDFEHRSYGEELALCQRYYEPFGNGWTVRGETTNSTVVIFGDFSVEKRANPTVLVLDTNLRIFQWGIADRIASTVSVNHNQTHKKGGHIKCGGWTTVITGELYGMGYTSTSNMGQPFAADAEL